MERDLLKKFCIVWASGGGRRGGAPPFNGPSAPWAAYGILTGLAPLWPTASMPLSAPLVGWTWISDFLIQRQAAIPIVGRSFVLLLGIRLCIFVPGKTLFLT